MNHLQDFGVDGRRDRTPVPARGQPGGETGPGSHAADAFGVTEEPLGLAEHLWASGWVRKLVLLTALAGAWQAYALWLGRPLLVPTFTSTAEAFCRAMTHGQLPARVV